MDMRIEVVFLGVTDVDRAKSFYVDQVGFHADHDQTVHEGLRFVQLTPPGSACSVAFGEGLTEMPPGAQQGVMMVVDDVAAQRERLVAERRRRVRGRRAAVGLVRHVRRPGRQHLEPAAAAAVEVSRRRRAARP